MVRDGLSQIVLPIVIYPQSDGMSPDYPHRELKLFLIDRRYSASTETRQKKAWHLERAKSDPYDISRLICLNFFPF